MFEEIQPSIVEPINLEQGAFKRTLTARGGVILAFQEGAGFPMRDFSRLDTPENVPDLITPPVQGE
jgi:hypothetical protein